MKKLKGLFVGMLLCSSFVTVATSLAAEPKKASPTVVTKAKDTFTVKNSQVELGNKWTAENNFEKATDTTGKALTWKEISKDVVIKGEVNTEKVGVYEIVYEYAKKKQTAKVEVIEKKEVKPVEIGIKELKSKNLTVSQGSEFKPSLAFVEAVKTDGTVANWQEVAEKIKVTHTVDTSKVGTYQVTFAIGDIKTTSEVVVSVTPIEIKLKPITIEIGSTWKAADSFIFVLMSDGSELNWETVSSEMIVTGDTGSNVPGEVVNTAKVGEYKVSYVYQGQTATTVVTVKEKIVPVTVKKIELKDTTIEVGSVWETSQNFVKVVMSDGKELAWKDVSTEMIVTGDTGTEVVGEVVNTKKAGTYKARYLYQGQTATATITVKEKIVPVTVKKIELKDTTIEVGSVWEASQNFVKVIMSDGKELAWKDVSSEMTVTGNTGTEILGQVVDTTKAGTYKANYLYQGQTATATITVKEKIVPVTVKKIELKDTTIEVGSKWEASQNFVKVIMSDGKELAWNDVSSEMTVTGNTGTEVLGQVVDTTKAGTYTASYLYKGMTATAKITVVQKKKQLVPVNKKVLPQTGEKLGIGTIISGVMLLMGVFFVILFKMKKVEDN